MIKQSVVIATAFSISFKPATEKFRNKHLFWSLEKEEELNPKPIENFDNIYKKLFMDQIKALNSSPR